MPALSLFFLLAPLQVAQAEDRTPDRVNQLSAPPVAGRVDYAVVVHPDNPTTVISSERLRRILRAEVQEWPTSLNIELLLPRSGTHEKRALLDLVYDMTDQQLKRYWTSLVYQNRIVDAPRAVPSNTVALRVVERTGGALTVVRAHEVPPNGRVKVLSVDQRLPGEEDYPLVLFARDIAEAKPVQPPIARVKEAAATLDQSLGERETDLAARVARLEGSLAAQESWDDGPPSLHLRAFGHMEAEYEEEIEDGVSDKGSTFSIESLDLLMTSALSDRVSVLAETVIDAQDEGDEDFKVEVERLLFKYRFSDALNLQAGRFLTSLGYWNTRYHHGEWLQTSLDRPEILDFEDDTGLLPLHNVGLALKGAFYTEALGIDYALEWANGRGATPDSTQVKFDGNDMKAVNASIGVEPSFLPGLRVGAGVYIDDIPGNFDADEGAVHGPLDEMITSAYAVYESSKWELFGEYFWIEHEDDTTTFDNSGWYVQVGRHIEDWTPYIRVDGLQRDADESFWEEPYDAFTWVVGLRYDVVEWAALTLQYEDSYTDVPDGEPNEETRTFVLQASFTF